MNINIEELLTTIESKYKNILPSNKVDEFELGRLVGQQDVIKEIYKTIEYINHNNSKKRSSYEVSYL